MEGITGAICQCSFKHRTHSSINTVLALFHQVCFIAVVVMPGVIAAGGRGGVGFGPEHDNEVTLYRTLNELTTKNLVRDLLHSAAFAVLTFMYL